MTLLLILVYIHSVFSKQPANCLKDIEDTWPRDGILRVEIVANASSNYTLTQSYKKEYGALNYHYLYEDPEKGASQNNKTMENIFNSTVIDNNVKYDREGQTLVEDLLMNNTNEVNKACSGFI